MLYCWRNCGWIFQRRGGRVRKEGYRRRRRGWGQGGWRRERERRREGGGGGRRGKRERRGSGEVCWIFEIVDRYEIHGLAQGEFVAAHASGVRERGERRGRNRKRGARWVHEGLYCRVFLIRLCLSEEKKGNEKSLAKLGYPSIALPIILFSFFTNKKKIKKIPLQKKRKGYR